LNGGPPRKKLLFGVDLLKVRHESPSKIVNCFPHPAWAASCLALLLGGAVFAQTPNIASEVVARAACSGCHLFPSPELLQRRIWTNEIFPKMRMYMGLDKVDTNKGPDAALLQARGFFPPAPMVTEDAWDRIVRWYVASAPGPTSTPSRNELIPIGLKQFRMAVPNTRRTPPLTTLVRIDPEERGVFTADATEQALDFYTAAGQLGHSLKVGNIVTSMQRTADGFYLGAIGHFFPTEDRRGQVIFLKKTAAGLERKVLFSELPRVAHIEMGDFNNDGKIDFALSMFGFMTGRFSWFENLGEDQFKEHLLYQKSGAVKATAHDFNKDGHLDIAALFGQETDGLILFMNDGRGNFTQREVFRRPPSYGHAYFELADFNGDGEMDFLVANGDNGDYEAPPKPYHGVRVYLKNGAKYEEAFFYPQHGAFKSMARDFDGDGDLDIASISFFPDYQSSPRESFVYLESKGNLRFEPSTFRECIAGRWVTMDAGDIDGDGDIDIVLGSMIRMPTEVPDFLKNMWEKSSPSLLYLINEQKAPAP
jgi:hypothetical protein